MPSEILHGCEGTPFVLVAHLQKNVQGPDAYRAIRGQDKANFRSHLAALVSVCLHIVFSTSQRHYRGTLKVAASAALSAIHLIANDKLWHRRNVHSAVSTLQQVFSRYTTIGVRDILRMLNLLPILPLWQAITETISISRRGGPEAAERASTLARPPLSGRLSGVSACETDLAG